MDEFGLTELKDVMAIGGGGSTSLAKKSDGTVWAWGLNDYGQLNDGTTTNRSVPVQLPGLGSLLGSLSGAASSKGTLWFDIAGPTPSLKGNMYSNLPYYSVLYVDGTVTLDGGTLALNFIYPYTPAQAAQDGVTFKLISATTVNGQFDQVDIYQDEVYQYTEDPNQPTLNVGFVIPHERYNFTFFPPVDDLPLLNLAKAGSAIPVKFSLSGNQGLDIFAWGEGYPKSQQIADTNAPGDEIEETVNTASNSWSYDPVTDQYKYVWKTDKTWSGTSRQLQLKLNDGFTHRANFKFK